jgi:prephenate dehydratase
MSNSEKTVAFQGIHGAYSDLACRTVRPELNTLPCRSFEDAFAAVRDEQAALAVLPIENSVAGRVADLHHLLPESGLHIIGEHFQRVEHHLLAVEGTKTAELTHVHSHVHALNQCRATIRKMGLEPVVQADTAEAARKVAKAGDRTQAAIASQLAGATYGLASIKANIQDAKNNTTRFLIMAREPIIPHPQAGAMITSFVFRVRNMPAALYKALGGFATNGVNMTKLESYMVAGRFYATQFYSEVEGHPEHRNVKLALEELGFFSREVRILGVFPAHTYRLEDDGEEEG